MLLQMRKTYAAIAVVAGSMLAGRAIGVAVFAPHLANAASNQSPPVVTLSGTQAPAASSGAFHSDEDPAHEARESPEREAEEDSGKVFADGGRGRHHGFNEDQAHEAQESPEREAQEDHESGGAGQPTPPQAADSARAQAS